MADTSAGRLVSFLVEGEDVVSCEICMEPFEGTRRPPKLLPCGHNFCQKCICSICFNQELNFAESMNCPTCRASFHISIAKNAPTNYDLCKVLESVQRGTEMANVTVIQVAAQPKDELSPPLRLLAQKSCALRHKKCSDCRRKLPSKTLVKTSRFCELCNTLETMKFTCLECCINRHNGHTLVTVRDLESNQLKAVSELRDARRKLIEKSEAFDRRLGQIGLQGHAASVASQKRHVFEELLGNNTETMRKLEAARLVSGAGLRNLRSEQVHDLSKLTKLCSVLEKTIVVERQPDKLSKSSSAFRQSRLTLRSDDSLAREVLINLLCVLPTNTLTNTLSMFVRSCSPKDTVEERMTIYFHCAKITTEILNGGVRVEDVCLIAESLLNCFYQLNILSRKRNEKGKMSRSNIWKLVQYSYSLVMAIITKAYPAYHPDRVEIIDDLAFLCHSYSDVCDQASIALITIEAARARCAESNLSAEDQKRTLERLTLIDDHLIELRRMQRLTDLRSKTTTRSTGANESIAVETKDMFLPKDLRRHPVGMLLLLVVLPLTVLSAPPFLFPHGYFDSNKLKPFDAIYLNMMAASNLEYGGTTVEELDDLDSSRKVIPRPEELERTREEDDGTLDRTPIQLENKGPVNEKKTNIPKNPFSKYRLLSYKDDPMHEENPFEEIATRAPPRSKNDFQRLRKQLRKDKKRKARRLDKRQKTKLRDRVTTTTVPPTLIPHPKIRRLPNNPFNSLDISKPNIVSLPIPPEFI